VTTGSSGSRRRNKSFNGVLGKYVPAELADDPAGKAKYRNKTIAFLRSEKKIGKEDG
jgi:hypothetical protein